MTEAGPMVTLMPPGALAAASPDQDLRPSSGIAPPEITVRIVNESNFLFVHGRLDDIIITGGENVAPAEVESALIEYPQITRAAVFGIPDDHWGERIVTLLVSTHIEPSPDELIQHLKTRLAGFKIPREFHFVEELPLTPAGKISRSALTDLLRRE